MTRTPSLHPRRACGRRRRSGFTVIELLVVIGIIVLLMGIMLPMLMKSYRSAQRTRIRADFASIDMALEAYKQDFHNYPPVYGVGTGEMPAGFGVLGRMLVGPGGPFPSAEPYASREFRAGECVYDSATTKEYIALSDVGAGVGVTDVNAWSPFPFSDGQQGPGIRARLDRPKHGPYLPQDKFKTRGAALLDLTGTPIAYFPQRPKVYNPAGNYRLMIAKSLATPPAPPGVFDADDNLILMRRAGEANNVAFKRLATFVGDFVADGDATNGDGLIAAAQAVPTEAPTQSYLLWSAGLDGRYGPDVDAGTGEVTKNTLGKCDDVTNFRQ